MSENIEPAEDAHQHFNSSHNGHSSEDAERYLEDRNEELGKCDPGNKNLLQSDKEEIQKDNITYAVMNTAHMPISVSELNIFSQMYKFLTENFWKRGRKVEKNVASNVLKKESSNEISAAISPVNSKKQSNDDLREPNTTYLIILYKKLQNYAIVATKIFKLNLQKYTFLMFIYRNLEITLNYYNVNSEIFRRIFFSEIDEENSNLKGSPISEGQFSTQPFDQPEKSKTPNIKTLDDSLKHFHLISQLINLENSLEAVRRKEKSEKDHKDFFQKIDKEMQRLSIQYHPDKVKSRGGTESEIATAQNLQTALNALRTALKFLNTAFIEDIGTEHSFRFYTKLSIGSVCNEDEMAERMYEVNLKMKMISQIKQQDIVPEIRKFLIESQNCIRHYLAKETDYFETARDAALLHLKYCIEGYRKLYIEIQKVTKQCKSEENSENMLSVLKPLESERARDLKLLESLEGTAKTSFNRKYRFFSSEEVMDPYFVLPFVSYIDVILMCDAMLKRAPASYKMFSYTEADPHIRSELSDLKDLYYLASYCSGNIRHKRTVLEMIYKKQPNDRCLKQQEITKEEIEFEFYESVKNISEKMKDKFNVNDYPEASTSNRDLEECMTMMTEFIKKEKEVSKTFHEFQKKAEKMNEEFEKFFKKMETAEEQYQEVEERLEESQRFNDMVSNFLLEYQ